MKRTVLVVDDQEVNRRVLGRILSDEYEVKYASDGIETLVVLREYAETISAVILDIIMPVMDGYEVLNEMSKDPLLSQIPVIVSSQADNKDTEIKALAYGANDFVAKPYNADVIKHRLANTIKLRETAAIINQVERDELTGLYNKQFFQKKAKEILKSDKDTTYALICIDIEKFKFINDTFGVSKGDQLLKYIGDLLLDGEISSELCSHFGADVFFLMDKYVDKKGKATLYKWEKLISSFDLNVKINVNFGVYIIDDITLPINVMCDRAQLAIDRIKGQYGEVYALYDDVIRQKLLKEQFIVNSMK